MMFSAAPLAEAITPNSDQALIHSWLVQDPKLAAFTRTLLALFPDKPIYIVGGALRDRLLGRQDKIKDFDIMVHGITEQQLFGEIQKLDPGASRNFFSGSHAELSSVPIDIWPLEESYHLKALKQFPTIAAFLVGAPLNFDKIAFELHSQLLHDEGCRGGIDAGKIAYAPAVPYLEHIQAMRAILLRDKIGLPFHPSVDALFIRVASTLTKDSTEAVELRQYLEQMLPPAQARLRAEKIIDEILTYRPQ